MVILDINNTSKTSLILRENTVVTVTTAAGSAATIYRVEIGQEPATLYTVGASSSRVVGPYLDSRPLLIVVTAGSATVTDADVSLSGGSGAAWGAITGTLSDQADLQTVIENVTPRTVTGAATINDSNHNGQMLVVNSPSSCTITLANDLPANSTGTILSIGTGTVTLDLETGDPVVTPGKTPVISGQYSAVQWVKLTSGTVLFGALT